MVIALVCLLKFVVSTRERSSFLWDNWNVYREFWLFLHADCYNNWSKPTVNSRLSGSSTKRNLFSACTCANSKNPSKRYKHHFMSVRMTLLDDGKFLCFCWWRHDIQERVDLLFAMPKLINRTFIIHTQTTAIHAAWRSCHVQTRVKSTKENQWITWRRITNQGTTENQTLIDNIDF